MKLLLLGTGGYHPNARRQTAGVLIPELGLMLDAGTSAFRVAERLLSKDLDVFLSHAHLDHIFGLTVLLVPMMKGEIARCRVHAEPHVIDAVTRHLFAESVFPVLPPFEFVPLAERTVVGNGRAVVTHCPLTHPGGSRGFVIEIDGRGSSAVSGQAPVAGSSQTHAVLATTDRVARHSVSSESSNHLACSSGNHDTECRATLSQPAADALPFTGEQTARNKRFAYITDTLADGSYREFIRGVDVLIHECNFPDDMAQWCEQTGHSHTSAVARLAKEAGVGRLYLTHIDPQRSGDDPIGLATARALFPETTLAEDLMEIEF